jgi:hypothetical protein
MKNTIAKILSEYIDGQILPNDFEKWIGENNSELKDLDKEMYKSLTQSNLNEYSTRLEIEKLVDEKIDYAQIHTSGIINLINQFENREIEVLAGMHKLYKWAELGYMFLAKIDLIGNFGEQGKSLVHLIDETMDKKTQWEKLTDMDPSFIDKLLSIKEKLEIGFIVLTGQKQKFDYVGNQYKYRE